MRRIHQFVFLMIVGCLAGHTTPCLAATYRVDKEHTSVSFAIRNFLSTAQGVFRDFQGTVDYDPGKPETWVSAGTIEVRSLDTKNSERDHHLLSKDFFDSEKFPTIVFKTTGVPHILKNGIHVDGFLGIHGIEKPVSLDIQGLTLSQDEHGTQRLKFVAVTKIDRRDFGITYSASGPGKIMLGDQVAVTLHVDAVRV